MVLYTSALVDRNKKADIRIEAAFGKMWGTERGWDIVNETMQIRGGRGYETAHSLAARGEEPVPVERFLRDCRINTIFEGSSEIMRLFIAREALDPHLRVAGPVLNSRLHWKTRLGAAVKSAWFYARWYPRLWMPVLRSGTPDVHPAFRRDLRKVRALSKKLARKLFHAMALHGPKLEKKQVLLGRFVDIGAEIFAMTASIARASRMIEQGKAEKPFELVRLVRYFCQSSRSRVTDLFRATTRNADKTGYQVARDAMKS